ncbi:uncharacterized protein TRAVEDRAFT_122036 [Trametes versicolor FP-101664 SS1]|uniref:uncharacterized protein n=1 Tax=Trametes versicolor (strain FP-101664) TaxID=717944 RepID=UPI0004621FB5|nr:uncharacterized protein TRAVEDRAFT_122036 [Trametes versicolor FP-101664 SS1]EIW59118.1 hypothetical protein TRAVEDRAFT_122036 [Trametes versicolor FP-101664 SS1]
MRHPYALVPDSRPPSLCSVHSRSCTPEPRSPPPPQPNRRPPTLDRSVSVPALRSVIPLGGIYPLPRTPAAVDTKKAKRGHYVKHSSRVTLLLSEQDEGAEVPAYSTGDTIEGILAIARSSGLLALEVKVEGTILIEELGGSGTRTVKVVDELVYSWIPSRNGPFPPQASFRYTLPTTFRDPDSGNRHPLPPTYSARLDGIPGFRVTIAYVVAVNLTRMREAASLWRGVTNMRVPFRCIHRTRPALQGPFPSLSQKTEDKPRTLFAFRLRPWRAGAPVIKVHVYLPASQVCSAQEPIPFHVSLLADELTLAPFAEYRPPATSFLSLSTSVSGSNTSSESVASSGRMPFLPLAVRKLQRAQRCPLRIQVQRTTVVDTQQSHLYCSEWIGQGVVHNTSRRANTVVWSGAIIIPPRAAGLGGGFEVDGMKVVDSIVLSIEPPSGSRPQYIPFSENVPLRLTSDSFACRNAMPVSPLAS